MSANQVHLGRVTRVRPLQRLQQVGGIFNPSDFLRCPGSRAKTTNSEMSAAGVDILQVLSISNATSRWYGLRTIGRCLRNLTTVMPDSKSRLSNYCTLDRRSYLCTY